MAPDSSFEQRDNDVNADKSTYSRLKEEIQNLIPEDDKEECQKRITFRTDLFTLLYGTSLDLEPTRTLLFRGIPQGTAGAPSHKTLVSAPLPPGNRPTRLGRILRRKSYEIEHT